MPLQHTMKVASAEAKRRPRAPSPKARPKPNAPKRTNKKTRPKPPQSQPCPQPHRVPRTPPKDQWLFKPTIIDKTRVPRTPPEDQGLFNFRGEAIEANPVRRPREAKKVSENQKKSSSPKRSWPRGTVGNDLYESSKEEKKKKRKL